MPISPAVASARARLGGLARAEGDMQAFAASGRAALRDKLLERFREELTAEAVERGEVLHPAELERRAELRRRRHYAALALKAAKAGDRKTSRKRAAAAPTSAAALETTGADHAAAPWEATNADVASADAPHTA